MSGSSDGRVFTNPGRELAYGTPPPFEEVPDLRVELRETEHFGIQMAWRSERHGLVATFPWWDHLEADRRFTDPTWEPVGTLDEPFVDAGQDWVFECWRDSGLVYWVEGLDIATWERRICVPGPIFDAAWSDGQRRLREQRPR
jgi:hypothetical protein